jgi:GrpB-like predicted nucleotidyltransferase (UPF0157 family)
MSDPIPQMKSRPVVLSPYTPRWAAEYRAIAGRVRSAAGASVLRIDHIGSTSVPGLAAKDVVDIQLTVVDLHDCGAMLAALHGVGFTRGETIEFDSPAMLPLGDAQLAKRYLREPAGERRTHVHVRQDGALNQRMALLFRDFLRAAPAMRAHYETVKRRAAALFPENIDGYIWLKDAPIQIMLEAALLWAQGTSWSPSADAD